MDGSYAVQSYLKAIAALNMSDKEISMGIIVPVLATDRLNMVELQEDEITRIKR